MTDLTLFLSPGACSRVTLNALEEIGLDFAVKLVDLSKNEQKSPGYLAVNPKGKVPALRIGDRVMTENPAILAYLDRTHPDARLLPHAADPITDSQALIDLTWCCATLHPLVRQIRNPQRFTAGDTSGVKANGMENFAPIVGSIASRVDGQRWWYGADWSILDVYLSWACTTAQAGGINLADFPTVLDHARRVEARPAFQRALAREREAVEAAR
jgi:glutathione S-transferase